MKKYGYRLALLTLLFLLGANFSSAFTFFLISPESSSFNLSSLESASTSIVISFPDITTDEEGSQPYKIERKTICNQYDENFNCIDAPPDLCPYLYMEPDSESTETGFPLNASTSWDVAFGELNILTDTTDNWTLSATSPCFEGECPADYDPSINGDPIPQSFKGQSFKCELEVNWNGGIFPVRNLTKNAYAAITNEMIMEAIFTGEGEHHIDPAIIIPGIMGSYLNREDLFINNERWPNILLMTVSPDDLFLNDLTLTTNGLSIQSISATEILSKIQDFDFFDGLVNEISGSDFKIYTFPYDWRLDVATIAQNLNDFIEEIKLQTSSDKVNIISHSMGGLVTKEYLDNFQEGSIGKFIDVGTPHSGSPKAFKILNYGDNFGFEKFGLDILNPQRTKIISQNMPSVYQLLPNMTYGSYLYDLDDLDDNGVNGPLSYDQTNDFMKNTGRNALLVDRAEQFHLEIDNIDPTDYGVETYNIVGCGTPTLDKIFILDKEASGGVEYNISYTSGDGTVPLKSAEELSANKTYYLKNATHALMPSTTGVKELIAEILKATSTTDFDISPYPNLAVSSIGCNMPNGKIISFHSPIDLHVYDFGGNHVGPTANGDIENNIPGVNYEVIDGNKFAFLPDAQEYVIKGVATDSGTFTARIQKITDEVVTDTEVFSNIALTSTTLVEVGSDTLSIDTDANGEPDELIFSDDTDLATIIKALKDKIQSLNIKDKLKKNLLNKIKNIEKKIEKKQKKDKSLEGLKAKIQNIINKIVKNESKGQIGDIDANYIIDLLEQIEIRL